VAFEGLNSDVRVELIADMDDACLMSPWKSIRQSYRIVVYEPWKSFRQSTVSLYVHLLYDINQLESSYHTSPWELANVCAVDDFKSKLESSFCTSPFLAKACETIVNLSH
jgi:hypothetical protein